MAAYEMNGYDMDKIYDHLGNYGTQKEEEKKKKGLIGADIWLK